MMGLMRLLILFVGGFRGGLLTLGGIFLVFAPGGVLLSLSCIVASSPFPGLWLIMMVVLVLLLILLFGLLVVLLKGDGLRCGIGLSYLGRLIFGLVLGSLLLSPLFLVMILRFGVFLLVCWLSGLPFSILYIGLRMGVAFLWVVCPMKSYSFCTNFVRERGLS